MSTRHLVDARLVHRPRPTATSIVWDPWWELSVDDGIHGAGPAGAASFTAPSGWTLWCDYADPDQLLRLDVPLGLAASEDSEEAALAEPILGDDDTRVVERLLGSDVVERLLGADETSFTRRVVEHSSWAIVGRIALIHTLLADRLQPLSGLWALEVAELIAELDAGNALASYRAELLAAAEPAVALLPDSLLESVSRDAKPLCHLLAVTSTREGRAFGPLAEAIRRNHAADVLEDVKVLLAEARGTFASSEQPDDWAVRAAAASGPIRGAIPAFRGVGRPTEPDVRLHLDDTVRGLISHGTGRVAEGRLTVRLALASPIQEGPDALRRLEILVTSDEGLVAAAAALEPTTDGLVATLRVPSSAQRSTLDVVVGRNLPQEPIDSFSFSERRAVNAGRRLADLLRHSPFPASTTVGEIRRSEEPLAGSVRSAADVTARAWQEAGRADLARAVDTVRPTSPLEVEHAAAVLDLETDVPALDQYVTDSDRMPVATLAAGRDLAWSLGDVERAAVLEAGRLAAGGGQDLGLAAHDTLTLALFARGRSEVRDLDLRLPG